MLLCLCSAITAARTLVKSLLVLDVSNVYLLAGGSHAEINVNEVDDFGNTALHLAVMTGQFDTVRFLIGTILVDCAVVNNAGLSPLQSLYQYVEKYGITVTDSDYSEYLDVACELVRRGADPTSRHGVISTSLQSLSEKSPEVRNRERRGVGEGEICGEWSRNCRPK